MPKIPFPKGHEGSENLPKTNQTLRNCWNNGRGRIIGRPGIPVLNTTSKVARGGFEWNGALYQVVSTSLIKITDTDTGAFSIIGTIAGSDPIETAIGHVHAGIVVRGGAIYSLSKTDVLTDISGNTNFRACSDIVHLDDRFLFIPADGTPAFFSDVGVIGTVQATSFFDAQVLPDKNNAAFVLKNTLAIMGENSIEFFQEHGSFSKPLYPDS